MGTYTTNKNLFMPTVGEQGWGTLVNGNFETIDNFLKPISLSGSTYTFTGNLVGNQSGGSVSATSITNSGTLTNTGKITANGGIGTKALTTTSISNSGTLTQTGTSTFTGKITANGGVGTTSLTTSSTITSTGQIVANGGMKLANGILYIPHNTTGGVLFFSADADLTMNANANKSFTFRVPNGNIRPVATSFTINLRGRIGMTGSSDYYGNYTVTENGTTIKSGTVTTSSETSLGSFTAKIGNTYVVTASAGEKYLHCYVRGAIYF